MKECSKSMSRKVRDPNFARRYFIGDGIDIGGKPSEGNKRYLPAKAWDSLSPSEKAATNKAKLQGNKQGKQFVAQPKKIAQKTKVFRRP